MKKALLLLTIGTLLSLSAFAQWGIGGSVGAVYDRPFLSQNKYDYFYYSGDIGFLDLSVNYQIDLCGLYQFNDRWSIASGLSFQQKGYKMNTSGSWSIITCGSSSVKYIDRYISLPIMMEFSFIKKEHDEVFVDAGAYGAFWCCSNRKSSVLSLSGNRTVIVEKKDFDCDVDRRFECGLIGGVGYKHHFSTKWTCFVTARYQYALTKQFKEVQTMDFFSRNSSIVLQIGLLYNFY